MRRLIYIFSLIAISTGLHAQVQVEQEIDDVAIMIGMQTNMSVSVTMPKGSKWALPNWEPRHYLSPGLEIISVSKADSAMVDAQTMRISETVVLTAFEESVYAIPAVDVIVDGKNYQGKALALKVMTVDVDTLHPNQFFPPKGIQDNPFMWSDWKNIFWLSVLMLFLLAVVSYLYIRLKQNKPIVARIRIVKHLPPHQKALASIKQIKEDKVAYAEDQKTYYTLLTDTLRRYITERFGFSAMEMTSDQIIEQLQSAGDKTMIDELKNLFATADMVKFAKYSTLINENDLNLINAIKFIDQTKIEGQVVEEKIVPQISTDEKKRMTQRNLAKWLIAILTISAIAIFLYVTIALYRM